MPGPTPDRELPSTLRRSPKKAQETYLAALASAEQQYRGDEARAHRTAYSALKRTFEKVGEHWEPKQRHGPSDEQATQHGRAARANPKPTAEGVDAKASRAHLLDIAKRLDIPRRSRMHKDELVEAIMRANRRRSAAARN